MQPIASPFEKIVSCQGAKITFLERGSFTKQEGSMAELIKIDKDVPIPEQKRLNAKKYPWNEMSIGDSFLIEKVNGELFKTVRSRAHSNVAHAAKRLGLKFCTRTDGDGIRVWRIK